MEIRHQRSLPSFQQVPKPARGEQVQVEDRVPDIAEGPTPLVAAGESHPEQELVGKSGAPDARCRGLKKEGGSARWVLVDAVSRAFRRRRPAQQ